MILQIENVLDRALVDAALEAASAGDFWSDGRATAAGRAQIAKHNLQSLVTGPAKGVIEAIIARLSMHDVFKSAAQPASFARIMLNRYDEGMEYGAHVDAPYVDGVRTDLSFTLFLSDPGAYDGGELVIESAGAEDSIKLKAGSLVLYPAGSLHKVARVTRGTRIACVGWVKSVVRDNQQRLAIFEMERISRDLAAINAPGAIRDRVQNLRNFLLRQFGD